jgi:phospholipase C
LILTYDEGGGFYDHVPPHSATPPDAVQFPIDLPSGDICDGNTSSPVCGFFTTGFRPASYSNFTVYEEELCVAHRHGLHGDFEVD